MRHHVPQESRTSLPFMYLVLYKWQTNYCQANSLFCNHLSLFNTPAISPTHSAKMYAHFLLTQEVSHRSFQIFHSSESRSATTIWLQGTQLSVAYVHTRTHTVQLGSFVMFNFLHEM